MSLRIVIPTIGLDNRGGTRIYLQLANTLAQRGHHVTILVPKGSNTTTFKLNPLVKLKTVGFKIPQIEDFTSIIRVLMLFPLLDDCDIVLANYYLTSFPIAFSSLFRRNRQYVNLIQHFEPLAFGEAERTFPKLKKWLGETSYRFPMHQVVVADWIGRRVSRISKLEVKVINPSIDLSIFKLENDANTFDRYSILAFPGKDIWKGWNDLIQAVRLLELTEPKIKITASSRFPFPLPDGPYRGVQPQNDTELVSLYRSAQVYVHPSWWEGCPLSPLEAMACGTPVVAAASEGIMEYAIDGQNCLLVPPKSPADLSNAILRVLNDRDLRLKLINGGLETVKRYAWPKMADQFEEFFQSICV